MAAKPNARKVLARLEPRSLPPDELKPPRANIGTAPDARMHAPPRMPQWKRVESALARLREGVRGQAGSARVHAAPTRSTRDPDATENIDIAGALAFGVQRPDGTDSLAARRRRQLAIKQCMEVMARIPDAAVDEFVRPEHCSACDGHGTEQTSVRFGLACSKCGGACDSNGRERPHDRLPGATCGLAEHLGYLALLDRLLELEREGAVLHAQAHA